MEDGGGGHQCVVSSDSLILHFDQHLQPRRSAPRLSLFPSLFFSLDCLSSRAEMVSSGDADAQLVMSLGELLHTRAGDRSGLACRRWEKKNVPVAEERDTKGKRPLHYE